MRNGILLAAVAFSSLQGIFRKTVIMYCILNAIIYVILSIIGISQPNKVLLSFEVLMLFALPGILFVILIAGMGTIRTKKILARGQDWETSLL